MANLNYQEIEYLEPKLRDLKAAITAWRDHSSKDCREIETVWHLNFKQSVKRLVGLMADDIQPPLRTTHAYDTVYREFEQLLPICRCVSCRS